VTSCYEWRPCPTPNRHQSQHHKLVQKWVVLFFHWVTCLWDAKKIQWDTRFISIFSIIPKSIIGKKSKKVVAFQKIMPTHGRTLCWGREGGILFSKMPYLLVEEKFNLKRHPVNTNTPKKYLSMLLWPLVSNYRLFQLVSFGNPIESNCLHRSPLRFEEIQHLTLEIIMLK